MVIKLVLPERFIGSFARISSFLTAEVHHPTHSFSIINERYASEVTFKYFSQLEVQAFEEMAAVPFTDIKLTT